MDAMNPVRPRSVAGWAVLVGLLWALGGRVGLLIGLAFVAYDLVRAPAPRELLVGSVMLFALVPIVVLLHGLPTMATLTPEFVTRNLVAHYLAGTALALLVVGILREVRGELRDGPYEARDRNDAAQAQVPERSDQH